MLYDALTSMVIIHQNNAWDKWFKELMELLGKSKLRFSFKKWKQEKKNKPSNCSFSSPSSFTWHAWSTTNDKINLAAFSFVPQLNINTYTISAIFILDMYVLNKSGSSSAKLAKYNAAQYSWKVLCIKDTFITISKPLSVQSVVISPRLQPFFTVSEESKSSSSNINWLSLSKPFRAIWPNFSKTLSKSTCFLNWEIVGWDSSLVFQCLAKYSMTFLYKTETELGRCCSCFQSTHIIANIKGNWGRSSYISNSFKKLSASLPDSSKGYCCSLALSFWQFDTLKKDLTNFSMLSWENPASETWTYPSCTPINSLVLFGRVVTIVWHPHITLSLRIFIFEPISS